MALIITHPDYVDLGAIVPAYEQLLEHGGGDPGVWRALPGEVADWWRRQAASSPVPEGDGWAVTGPAAAEAEIRWTEPGAAAGDVVSAQPAERGRGTGAA